MPDPTGLHVVIYGDPIDGIVLIGPFETPDDATRYAEQTFKADWWIAPLQAPFEN